MKGTRRLVPLACLIVAFAACSSFSSGDGGDPTVDTEGGATTETGPQPDAACASTQVSTLKNGLVAYWRFDGDGSDATGNGHGLVPTAECGDMASYADGQRDRAFHPGL